MTYLNYVKLSVLVYAMLFMTTAILAQSANSPSLYGITSAIQAGEICSNGIDDDGDGLTDALDPDCCGGWETRGSATTINGTAPYDYRLTDAVGTQGGGIWSTSRLNFSQSFNIAFQANFGTLDANGADGIAFVIHNDPLGYNALIPSGGNLGVGMVPCFTTEFDTWDNGAISADIPADHVAVYANNQVSNIPGGNAIQASVTSINIEDGAWHNIIIDWNAATLTFTVTFDGVQRIQTIFDFVQNIFAGNPILYFGFTASTGGSFNVQQVRNIVMAGTLVEVCGDGIDNDCDNLVDCADTDCQFTATATAGTSLCGNASVPLSVTTAPVVASNNVNLPLYAWAGVNNFTATTSNTSVTGINSSADGLYSVTVTANSGCTATASVNVSTFPMPVPVVSSNSPVCAGSNLVLTATAGTTYAWSGPNNYSSTSPDSTIISNVTSVESGLYTVTITDNNGCTGTGQVMTSLVDVPTILLDAVDVECFGGNDGAVSVTASPVGNYNYLWTPGGYTTTSVANLAANTYTVQVSYVSGPTCTVQSSIVVNDGIQAIVNAGADISLNIGSAATLTATPNDPAYTYTWVGSDGSTFTGNSILVSPENTIQYIVTAQSGNCVVTDSITVVTTNGYRFPTAFTPNGDGENDVFYPSLQGAETIIRFDVFDRWGNKVHRNASTPWNGAFDGTDLPRDVYVYYTVFRLPNGREFGVKGDITLIR